MHLNTTFTTKQAITSSLKYTERYYRPYDPGSYLYDKILSERVFEDKFKDNFIELVYVTLSAWNMNSRGARLADFKDFRNSIKANKKTFKELNKYDIFTARKNKTRVFSLIEDLFYNLRLVGKDKPRLVTFSKTLHFYLPNLVVPIDRRYTLNFFHGHTGINKKPALQWKKFQAIFEEMIEFAPKLKNIKLSNPRWSKNTPKTIDNLIIGYMQKNKSENSNY